MGADRAAVHAASKKASRIAQDQEDRPSQWQQEAAAAALEATKRDFEDYLALG
jgi:adenosyl cobinamide kinase/adenosyl cobinamide phosphate guanylyltransferase